jgi:hypothetical protein
MRRGITREFAELDLASWQDPEVRVIHAMEQHVLLVDRYSGYSVMKPVLVVGEVNHLLSLMPH